ncbi:5-oxoprolinase subunit PxpA [Gaetbulibacter aestuarii]|uniref:5-oxoprolinase subunit PxpA n=1 Tax=Gaetbulibacter aestuarii TaxID=1502358 RepID=A0ABW7N175_9FLAO
MDLQTIDINVDMGEGLENEALIMPFIASCNIACGGHAGTEESMRKVVGLAQRHRVKIGAHPSFPDKENFGRQAMDISYSALFYALKHQLDDFMDVLEETHARLHHIKPHGALYNLAAVDENIANVIIELVQSIALPMKLYVPYKSVIADLARKQKIPISFEAFADRNYHDDLTLVSRSEPNALITDNHAVFEHIQNMVLHHQVVTVSGHQIPIEADTFCVHGDHPNAPDLIKYLHEKLTRLGYKIR